MAQGKSSIVKSAGNLALTCILCGAVIAGTYAVTSPVAAQNAEKQKAKAMQELVPDGQQFQAISGKTGWYSVLKDGKTIAYVVPAESKGYGGTIKMMAAVDPEGKAIDYKILEHNETPGLGDNATKPNFRKQFKGKSAEDLTVVKTPTDKNIQAMTGATITSRAVTLGIKNAVEEVKQYISNK